MENGVPSLLLQAAQSAALADGVAPPLPDQSQMMKAKPNMTPMGTGSTGTTTTTTTTGVGVGPSGTTQPLPGGGGGGGKKKGPPLRRGKWTPEEEAYANRLIQEFKAGLLPLTDGTTLRTFLSKLLNCDPMRISKKFVGSNCIGKQVFRRRTADLNRLTPEQIQKSRAELSELERRFLERVAQTNRVKSNGVGGTGPPTGPGPVNGVEGIKKEDFENAMNPPSPPWLQPPLGYKQGTGAAMAAANLSSGAGAGGNSNSGTAIGSGVNSRAAAAGRALLEGFSSSRKNTSVMNAQDNAGLLAMAELQRRASQSSLLQSMGGGSTNNFFATPQGSMAQLAQNASAARMGLGGGNSINNLMLKGLSRDQLNQLTRDRGLSSASLSNMIDRKSSFDALMGLDFQSLQSIDNLANLVQSGGNMNNIPTSGLQNWSAEQTRNASNGSLSHAARRLASAGNMESLLRSLSNNNVKNGNMGNDDGRPSSANLQSLLQNMQSGNSMSSLLAGTGNMASTASLANLLRDNSSTGLSALRMQDGFNQRNSSVEDFLNLVADGYIPHQDPGLLSIPLMHHQQNNGQGGGGNDAAAATMLAQQQLLAQATGNSQLANALASRSFGNLARNASGTLGNAVSFFSQTTPTDQNSSISLKRRFLEMEGDISNNGGPSKR